MRGELGKHACKPKESGMVELDSWICPFCAVVHRHGDIERAAVNCQLPVKDGWAIPQKELHSGMLLSLGKMPVL